MIIPNLARQSGTGKRQMMRQKVLVLYLANSALDAPTVAWAVYDGTGETRPMSGDTDTPPYKTGVDALKDGWRLFQAARSFS